MYTEWTKHLKDQEDKTNFENQVRAAKPVLERLRNLLDERDYSADKFELTLSNFDTPNWPYKQAFNNGFRSCLNIVRKYLEDEQFIRRNDQSGNR